MSTDYTVHELAELMHLCELRRLAEDAAAYSLCGDRCIVAVFVDPERHGVNVYHVYGCAIKHSVHIDARSGEWRDALASAVRERLAACSGSPTVLLVYASAGECRYGVEARIPVNAQDEVEAYCASELAASTTAMLIGSLFSIEL